MRTVALLLLALILLSACSGSSSQPTPSPTSDQIATLEPESAATTADATAGPPEPAIPAPTAAAGPIQVTGTASDLLNVRAGPGLTFPVKSQIKQGDKMVITGRSADNLWWQIQGGWVSQTYVTVAGNSTGVPVVTPAPQ